MEGEERKERRGRRAEKHRQESSRGDERKNDGFGVDNGRCGGDPHQYLSVITGSSSRDTVHVDN